MTINDKRVLICDCERTMTFDIHKLAAALGIDEPFLHTHLCRTQIDHFREAAASGEPLLVCCTQEAPLFDEVARDVSGEDRAATTYVNIRERAGWSEQGVAAEAKIAALLAEAALDIEPTPAVTLRSDGIALVYGIGEEALAAARRLSGRLNVTCLLKQNAGFLPPHVIDVPIFRGRVRAARGHLGAFELTIDDFAAYAPSAREALSFETPRDGAVFACDLILDLSGDSPLFPAPHLRDGYVRAEASSPVQVQQALFDIADMVGEFEKPRYLRVDPAICAHSRSGIVGCDLCLTVCPTGAIAPAGDHTAVDPKVCAGHGACASVCPTGAIVFDLPRGPALFERLRVLTKTYHEAGGRDMVLLVHDPRYGEEMIAILARTGRGLPANVVPFVVNEITQIGLDFLLTALAYGIAEIRILAAPEHRETLGPLRGHAELIETVMTGLGYAGRPVRIDDEADPVALEASLYRGAPSPAATPARYRVMDDKRTTLMLALDHLHAHAPAPVDGLDLPAGAPFGQVKLRLERCTLCLACVGACPTAALGDNPDRPMLTFTEINCVQCGLCRNTCPEDAILLAPRLNFQESAKNKVVLKEEEPFECIRCGKPFGSQSTIERLLGRLAGHPMFALPRRLELLKMCEDCRVVAQFEEQAPFAHGPRPLPRTTDDDLRERERARQHGSGPGGTG